MRESLREIQKQNKRDASKLRFNQKRMAERQVGSGDRFKGLRTERDNIQRDKRTNAEVELSSIERIERRERENERYVMSAGNIAMRLFNASEAGKQWEQQQTEMLQARWRILQRLKKYVPETCAEYSKLWKLPV